MAHIKLTPEQMNAALHQYRLLDDPKDVYSWLGGKFTSDTENNYEADLSRLMKVNAKCHYDTWKDAQDEAKRR